MPGKNLMLRKPLTPVSQLFFSVKSSKINSKTFFVRAFRVVGGQDFEQKRFTTKHTCG